MLRTVASRVAPTLRASVLRGGAPRAFSIETQLSDKERAEERMHFMKEDERLLRKLLSKIKAQADAADVHEAAGVDASERSALASIIGKYNVSAADVDKLMEWKHTH